MHPAEVAVWAEMHAHGFTVSVALRGGGFFVSATHYWIVPCQKEDCFCRVFLDGLKTLK